MLLLKFRRFRLGRLPYAAWALVYFCLCGLVPSTLAQTSTGVGKPEQTKNTNHVVESTWTDTTTGLIWTKKDNGSDVNWNQASAYCQSLRLGGNSDWRLPTIDEFNGIYDPSVDIPGYIRGQAYHDYTRVGEAVTWHVKGGLRLSGEHWSSTTVNPSGYAWYFSFSNGKRYSAPPFYTHDGARALCVRRPAAEGTQTANGDDVANWVKIYMNQREPTVTYSNITFSNGDWKRGRLEKSIEGEVVAPCKVHVTLRNSAVWNSSFEPSDSSSEVRQCVVNLRDMPASSIQIQKLDANSSVTLNNLATTNPSDVTPYVNGTKVTAQATISWLLEVMDKRRVDCNPVGIFNPKGGMAITYLSEQEANEAAKSLKFLIRNSCSSVDDIKRNSTAIAAEQSDQPLPWIELESPIVSLPVASIFAKKTEVINTSAEYMAGLLLIKTPPVYPPEAKAAKVQGTVVLEGTISKTGSIENLRVISGPDMLQQAALDAVKTWRYKPYLVNGEPVEVVTTINVIFTLSG